MIDLLLGGSPCQGFSFAGKQLNFFDPRSKLFFDYVEAKKALNPKYFLLENVKMKQEFQDVISKHLGVEPIEINSALVSAQNRVRFYWTNIPGIQQPEDKGVLLNTVIQANIDQDLIVPISSINNPVFKKNYLQWDTKGKGYASQDQRAFYLNGKHGTLPHASGSSKVKVLLDKEKLLVKKLSPVEAERLQTLADNYTDILSNHQRYGVIGNGWTVDVIAHILSFIPDNHLQTVVSLFDGISCGQVALERSGKLYNQYYASEIDENAIKVTQKNYPHTMQLGDVTKIDWVAFLDRLAMIQKVS